MRINWQVLLVYAVQIALVVHVFRTGRNRLWIFLLIFAPFIGGLAYLLVEILPGLAGSLTGQRAMRSVKAAVNPLGDLRHHAAAFEHSPNAENARRYAGALLDSRNPAEAGRVLDQAMSGLFRTDPDLMLLRARVHHATDDPAAAAALLQALWEANPEFKSPEARLLLAQSLTDAGRQDEGLTAFHRAAENFPGAEARYRLGHALQAAGQTTEAREVYEQLARDAKHAPAHYRRAQGEWLRRAARELKEIS